MNFHSSGAKRVECFYGNDVYSKYAYDYQYMDMPPLGHGKHQNRTMENDADPVDLAKQQRQAVENLAHKFYQRTSILLIYESKRRFISLSTTRVRQRLNDLMGTDVIRLNDKRYFQKLSRKLQEEYDTHMDKQEDARCAAEDQRLRRLMLEGIINDPSDYRAIVHGERVKKGIKKKKKRRSKKRTADGSPAYTSETTSAGLARHGDENGDLDLVTQVSILSGTHQAPSSSHHDSKPYTPETRHTSPRKLSSHDKENSNLELHARPPHHEILRTSSSCSTHRKSRRIQSASSRLVRWQPGLQDDESEEEEFDYKSLPGNTARPPSKFSKHEPELIKTLRQEETVAGLYSLAEELVSPVKTEELVDSRKVNNTKPNKPKKKMTVQF